MFTSTSYDDDDGEISLLLELVRVEFQIREMLDLDWIGSGFFNRQRSDHCVCVCARISNSQLIACGLCRYSHNGSAVESRF